MVGRRRGAPVHRERRLSAERGSPPRSRGRGAKGWGREQGHEGEPGEGTGGERPGWGRVGRGDSETGTRWGNADGPRPLVLLAFVGPRSACRVAVCAAGHPRRRAATVAATPPARSRGSGAAVTAARHMVCRAARVGHGGGGRVDWKRQPPPHPPSPACPPRQWEGGAIGVHPSGRGDGVSRAG